MRPGAEPRAQRQVATGQDITECADKVLRRKISVSGVGQVLILGGRQRQINVWLDADRLRGYNLTVASRAREAEHQIPGGRSIGPAVVTLHAAAGQTVAEFGGSWSAGAVTGRIADVARVEDGEPIHTLANVDGASTVLLPVRRQSGPTPSRSCARSR
jgi:multidrug efflux pump subunit AcrB